jgi:ABC-type uncharacterized transport system permease subunit
MLESFGLYTRLLRSQIKSQMQYRFSFVLDVCSTALFTLTEFSALFLVFSQFSSLGGWSLAQVMLLYGMVELSFGIMDMVFAGFDPPFFSNLIRKGMLDQLMLRPRGLVLQIFGADFTLRRIGRIVLGGCILAYALHTNPIDWDVFKALLLPLAALGMILYFGALFLVGATIQFWTVESSEAMNVLSDEHLQRLDAGGIYFYCASRTAEFLPCALYFRQARPIWAACGSCLPCTRGWWRAICLGAEVLAFWLKALPKHWYINSIFCYTTCAHGQL